MEGGGKARQKRFGSKTVRDVRPSTTPGLTLLVELQRTPCSFALPGCGWRWTRGRYSLRAKAVDFSKILAQIDGMVKVLGNEQTDDDEQKSFCDKVREARGWAFHGRSATF